MDQKRFDCVEMKDRIQAGMQKEFEGLSGDEVRERIRHRLEMSDSLVAKKWREMQKSKPPISAD